MSDIFGLSHNDRHQSVTYQQCLISMWDISKCQTSMWGMPKTSDTDMGDVRNSRYHSGIYWKWQTFMWDMSGINVGHAIHGNHQYGICWQCQTSIQNTPHVRHPPDLVTCMSHITYHTTWGLISGMPENPNVARKVWPYLCCFYMIFFSEKTFKKR